MNRLPLAAQSLVDPVAVDEFVVEAEVLADAAIVAAEELDFFDVEAVSRWWCSCRRRCR
jgi:hypothetical protein